MKIIWNENPLLTRVEMDDEDRRRLRAAVGAYLNKYDDIRDAKEGDRFTGYAIKALEEEEHCGDCTCVPASCEKCFAEEMLSIDTIKGCGKHQLYKIRDAFKDGVGITDAIARLEAYEPKAEWEGWEAHVPRWKAEAKDALKWLCAYRDEHFSGVTA